MSKVRHEIVKWPDGTFGVLKIKSTWFTRAKISYISNCDYEWVEPCQIHKYCRMTWEEAIRVFSNSEVKGFIKGAKVVGPFDRGSGQGDGRPFGPPSRK